MSRYGSNKFTLLVVQVCTIVILVNLLFIPLVRSLSFMMFYLLPLLLKNLVSVHCLIADNNVFLEFNPDFFFIKDRDTRSTLLRGTCRWGLCALRSTPAIKQDFGVSKQSFNRWHSRLDHPSVPIVQKVVQSHKLPYYFISIRLLCVMIASKPKVINFHTLNQLARLALPWSLFSVMFGDLRLIQ